MAVPPSPRGRFSAGMLLAVAIAFAAAGAAGAVAFHHRAGVGAEQAAATAERWQCPMHPSVVEDHPGECPICSMKLVKLGSTPPGGGQDRPRGSPADPDADELTTVDIDPARQQLIGLTTAPVESGPVGGAWRTSGKVAVDQTRLHHVNLKVGGYVTRAHAEFVGQAVRQGEPLFSLYSPDLLAAQEEYLLALRTREALRKGGGGLADGDDLVASARRKLELWDVPAPELDRLARTGVPMKDLTFYAPHPGVITKRDAIPGMRVNAGDMPIELVDLSRVWVLADVYETELRHVKLGMPATLTLKAYPDRTFRGRVAFIAPQLDPATRTIAVRIEFPNPSGELKPDMFGEVVLQGKAHPGLRIPDDAVVDSGTRAFVFASLGDGRFQPRRVELGDSDGDHVEVVKGLSAGDRVVTRANFLIDSESRLKASLAAMGAGTRPADRAAAGVPSTAGAGAEPAAGEAAPERQASVAGEGR